MKKNKLVITCLIVGAVGIVLGIIGASLGGSVYGISIGGDGVNVCTNVTGSGNTNPQMISDSMTLEEFQNLKLDIDFSDLTIVESDHYGLEYCVREDIPVTASMQGDTMVITQRSNGMNVTIFSFGCLSYGNGSFSNQITVYLPKDVTLDTVTIIMDSGDLKMDDLKADKITIDDSFGSIETGLLEANDMDITLDSGDLTSAEIQTNELYIKDNFGSVTIDQISLTSGKIEMDSGDAKFGNVTGGTLTLDNSFGSVEAERIEVDSFTAQLDSGDLEIEGIASQSCDVDSNFGEANIGVIGGINTYAYEVDTDFGEIEVNGEDMGVVFKTTDSTGKPKLMISCDSGDITLYDVQ